MMGQFVSRVMRRIDRVFSLWSLSIEGEVTWWCSDDVNHRTRKLDYEIRLPKRLLRPRCWWRGDHDPHYGRCIYCNAPTPGRG